MTPGTESRRPSSLPRSPTPLVNTTKFQRDRLQHFTHSRRNAPPGLSFSAITCNMAARESAAPEVQSRMLGFYAPLLARPVRALLLRLVLLGLSGCGGSSGGGDQVYNPPTNPGPQVNAATVRLNSILERAVPGEVTHLRCTGFDSRGQARYGPVSKPKAARIDFPNVPLDVVRWQVEYLSNSSPVGVGSTPVVLIAGQVFEIENLDFQDIEATLTDLKVVPAEAVLPLGLTRKFSAMGTFSDGARVDLSGSVLWSSSNPTVSPISEQGLATVPCKISHL